MSCLKFLTLSINRFPWREFKKIPQVWCVWLLFYQRIRDYKENGSDGKESACNGDLGLIPGSVRPPWRRGLQYSSLENPMNRGALQVTIHRVAKSWAWLKWPSLPMELNPSPTAILQPRQGLGWSSSKVCAFYYCKQQWLKQQEEKVYMKNVQI